MPANTQTGRPTAPIRPSRALLSVSDKTGLIELAETLHALGCELISTGGTARAIADAGLPVTPVDRVTGFPEIMDGRVKTLHPKIHGGLLFRRDLPEHADQAAELGIRPIDLVCVNLYPFEQTIERDGVTHEQAVEQIDIGGPSMVRSAAKNHASVAILTDPHQYPRLLQELTEHDGATTLALRTQLAAEAFDRTAKYDEAIAAYMREHTGGSAPSAQAQNFPEAITLRYQRASELRYGENPHQRAAAYRDPSFTGPSVLTAEQLAGKPLSYNNLNDAAAALTLAQDLARLGRPAAAVVKHTNPCGAASAGSAAEAVELALAGDPLAAYGGILACSSELNAETAERLCADSAFLEVVIAPAFSAQAVTTLNARWKNLRLLATGHLNADTSTPPRTIRPIPGGALMQDADADAPDPASWIHAAGPTPTSADLQHAASLVCVVRALSSNAVCLGGSPSDQLDAADPPVMLFGAGAGQMDRVASCRLAIAKAGEHARSSIAASDAFFPFDDGPRLLADAGVRMIVHPGGSKRDADTFALCETAGITCMTTGVRHFRH